MLAEAAQQQQQQGTLARYGRWLTWLCLVLAAAAFARVAIYAALTPVADPDVWWVAAAGRDMLSGGGVPRTNAYSFTEPTRPWLMHEWGFGYLYGWGLGRLGPFFFNIAALIVAAITSGIFVVSLVRQSGRPALGAALAALGLYCFGTRLAHPRASNLALVFPVAMAALAFSRQFTWRHVALAVVVEFFWANFHGSFPLGIVLLGVGVLLSPEGRRERVVAGVLSLLVTLINPYGLHLHALTVEYALGASAIFKEIHTYVVEFRPLWRAPGLLWWDAWAGLVGMVALTGFALWARRWRARGAWALLFLAMGVVNVRHLELAGFVCFLLLAPALEEIPGSLWARVPVSPLRAIVLGVVPGLVLAGALALALPARDPLRWIDPWVGGASAARLTQRLPPGANVYVPFKATGLVIWFGAPHQVRVFYDARNDCYSAEMARTFFEIDAGKLSPEEVRARLEKHGTSHALVSRDHPVLKALEGAAGWRQVDQEGSNWVVLARGTETPGTP